MANDRIHVAQGKGMIQMGSAILLFYTCTFLLSAYFLTSQTCKRMRLITRVYSVLLTVLKHAKQKYVYIIWSHGILAT